MTKTEPSARTGGKEGCEAALGPDKMSRGIVRERSSRCASATIVHGSRRTANAMRCTDPRCPFGTRSARCHESADARRTDGARARDLGRSDATERGLALGCSKRPGEAECLRCGGGESDVDDRTNPRFCSPLLQTRADRSAVRSCDRTGLAASHSGKARPRKSLGEAHCAFQGHRQGGPEGRFGSPYAPSPVELKKPDLSSDQHRILNPQI